MFNIPRLIIYDNIGYFVPRNLSLYALSALIPFFFVIIQYSFSLYLSSYVSFNMYSLFPNLLCWQQPSPLLSLYVSQWPTDHKTILRPAEQFLFTVSCGTFPWSLLPLITAYNFYTYILHTMSVGHLFCPFFLPDWGNTGCSRVKSFSLPLFETACRKPVKLEMK